MSQLELKIPPPLVAAALAAGMVSVAIWLGPVLQWPAALRVGGSVLLAALGGAFDVAGILAFRKAQTTVNPMAPERSSKLVVSGVYRITRNPMYLGIVLILLALALYLAAPWALLGPLLFAAYITRFQIRPEERAMQARFGAEFAAYCAWVRRWI